MCDSTFHGLTCQAEAFQDVSRRQVNLERSGSPESPPPLRPAPLVSSGGGRALSFVPPAVRPEPDGGDANLPPLRRQAWGGEVSAGDGRIPGAARAALGIYARIASLGDIIEDPEQQARMRRAERMRLKFAADELRGGRQRACHRARQSKDRPVTVEMGARKRAYWGGLQVCGSVWGCPLCAASISERRRKELAEAIVAANFQGLQVVLVTLTIRHGVGDDVRDMLRRMSDARRRMTSGRRGVAWRIAVGLRGSVRALEVTHGVNGWHPHYHILLFLGPHQLTLEQIAAGYGERWIAACVKAGLPAPLPGVACTVQDGTRASTYVSKWGLPEELAKAHVKHARAHVGRTPMDLLRAYADDGDERAGQLWREYAAAFKGQRQLWWSHGLRAMLGLPDVLPDEEAAQVDEVGAEVLQVVTEYQRRALVNVRGALCAVLDVAETNREMLPIYIQGIVRDYYRAHPEQRRRAARGLVRELADPG